MEVKLIEPAQIELEDAIEYYNIQSAGLGDRFFNEVLDMIEVIKIFPKAWTHISRNTRKAILKNFPYNLIYTIYHNKIYILAVAHQHREPEYWVNRIFKN